MTSTSSTTLPGNPMRLAFNRRCVSNIVIGHLAEIPTVWTNHLGEPSKLEDESNIKKTPVELGKI
jgi:hypothetical protein